MKGSSFDLDACLAKARQCQTLEESEVRELCFLVQTYLMEEANIQNVPAPVIICGDIHGQFHDLLRLFEVGGDAANTNYVFLVSSHFFTQMISNVQGDYVDRGRNSIETLMLLLLLKAKYPHRITLLRGNHECRQITQVYGFYDEIQQKYGNANVWKYCVQVFDFMNLAALVDGRVLCVHGGLSPDISTLDQIMTIHRAQEIPHQGSLADLVWSDPEELDSGGWALSPRGAGYLFGNKVTADFCQVNDLTMIVRAHQLVQEGYKFMFPEKNLVTIWSAPNYCYRCGNVAAVLQLDESLEVDESSFKIFESVSPEGGDALQQNIRNIAKLYFQ